ncbi:MAG: hypothetical protein CSA40_00630 [Flavobacteriales bacterium]|nr:MAG: hypothetical protein CSA40_00630 [Flavobacteriales bacterium]
MEKQPKTMTVKHLIFVFFITISVQLMAQTGTISGHVMSESDNSPIAFADVVLENTNYFTTTDEDGRFIIEEIKPGTYNMLIGVTEIYRSPGANRDVSFVVRNLPGVATSTNNFRNDLIVRGGAPGENRFFMDGIEIPNINHFATQGSSGGPVGMINVNFIQGVDFYTGSFPVSRGNALSSVMDITTRFPSQDKLSGSVTLGSSDLGLTMDVPTGKNSGILLSARRSYLQLLFEQLKLPFLPIYNDFQYSHRIKINDRNQLTILGLGAIDNFKLNTSVNDGVEDPDILERNTYILNNIPKFEQWNYAIGVNWRHNTDVGYQNFILSRNMLNNTSNKYLYNIEVADNLLFDYQSQEIENKLRYEYHHTAGDWKWYAGAGVQHVKFNNETYQKIIVSGTEQILDFTSDLSFQKYALFVHINRSLINNKLDLSAGLRTDFNSFSKTMSNPLSQLSPRLSLSYNINAQNKVVVSAGHYTQLPAYTILGYRDNAGTLVNQDNVDYIHANHYVAGYQWIPKDYLQLKFESFYKSYSKYPFSINDGISLANLGSGYGVIGNEPVNSNSKGYSYGFEVSATQKLSDKLFGSFSYTFVRSRFDDGNGNYTYSAWDNKHVLNVVSGYKLARNWEIGVKFRLLGGAPYTPYDLETSSLQTVWDINQQGLLNYAQLNTERLPLSHGIDFRVDKKWYFKHWALNLYLDIQNAYNAKTTNPPYFNVLYGEDGLPLVSDNDPQRYQYKLIENESGTVLPSIGLMVDF